MTSSNRKKAKKVADFKKTKLKVGKAVQKPANFTSTTFKSKTITLHTQSLSISAPTVSTKLAHHFSLLTHHASTVRKDALHHIATHLPASLALPLPKLAPLVLDPSKTVRANLHTLLTTRTNTPALRAAARIHLRSALLHVYAAASHLEPDVRADAPKFLAWALDVGASETLAGDGWRRGLTALGALVAPPGTKRTMDNLGVLRAFVEAGFVDRADEVDEAGGGAWKHGMYWRGQVHAACAGVGAFSALSLFQSADTQEGDGGGGAGEDVESRRRWCSHAGKETVDKVRYALAGLVKEGGEVGRVAAKVEGVLMLGLAGGEL